MENWILVVGYSRPYFEAAQKEWLKYNVLLQSVANVNATIAMISTRPYLAVIVSYDVSDMPLLIDTMREARKIPLLILSQEDSGTKMAESIIRGADTFVIDPDKLIESIWWVVTAKNHVITYQNHRLSAELIAIRSV